MKNYLQKYFVVVVLLIFSSQAWAQSRTITGKVRDEATNEWMAGVIVAEKGSTNATQTAQDGSYSLTIPDTTKKIVFMMVGYETKTVEPGNDMHVNVALKASIQNLNETVVVAYGESKKSDVTGSLTKVDAKVFEDVPVASLDLILAGQVAGLQVSSYSGQPGGSAEVRLRGIGSITAGTDPLYVVDGIPINSGTLGSGLTWTSNSLAGINPDDIESVTVLKDAAATAIYGSRGGNGVIIITTKKGKAGKTQFHFDCNYGVNEIAFNNIAKPLNASQYSSLTYQGLINAGYSDTAAQAQLNSLGAGRGANTDWLKEVTQQGAQQSYNLSAQGGDEKTQFFISGGYFSQQGVTLASAFDRISGSLKLDHKVNKRLKFGTNIMLSSSDQKTPYQSAYFRSPISSAYFNLPYMRPYDSTGKVNTNTDEFFFMYNPVAIANLDNNYFKNTKMIGGINGELMIVEGLKLSSNLSIDYNNTNEFFYQNPFYGDGAPTNGWAEQTNTEMINWVWTNMLDYQKKFINDNLSLDIKAGHEAQQSEQNILEAAGVGFPPSTSIQVLSVSSDPKVANSSISDYSFESYFSSASLNYQSKYLLTGSFRNDGSSRFGIDDRYGNFYSVGGSWMINKEDFLKDSKVISTLRLRSSYGRNGNANIGNYAWQALSGYSTGSGYNSIIGSAPTSPGNNNLTWEKNTPLDAGLDAGFFKERLDVTADYYDRKTTDLLLNVPVSQTTGFSTQLANVGAMENKGLELTINGVIIKSKAVTWNSNFNIAFNSNKVTALYDNQDIISGATIYRVGQSTQSFYLPLWAGVDPATGNPLWYTDSTKKHTTSNVADAKPAVTGNIQPKFFGGYSNSVSWKKFTFSFQFTFVYGNKVFDNWAYYLQSDGANPTINQTTAELGAWTHAGEITNVPKFVYDNTSNSNYNSTRFLYDGTYIRLKHITLAYNFSPQLLTKYRMNSLSVYLKATNLYTWVKDKRVDFDPDVTTGYTDLNIPNIKSMIGGINIGF